jgi:hypothetical protein
LKENRSVHSEDRIIHLSTELFHQPQQYRLPTLQRLYYELSQEQGVGYDNTDFNQPQQPKFYTRRGERTQSALVMFPDRALFLEEWADAPLETFAKRLATASAKVLEVLEIPAFVTQTVMLRTTCALTHFNNANTFLLDHACQQGGKLTPYFQRPVAVGGLRFLLPETKEQAGALNVTIEPFRQSPKEIYVEVRALYKGLRINPDETAMAAEQLRAIRHFITDNVYPYLNQFDVPVEHTP